MQSYTYKVKYIKGSKNIADSLSRLLVESKGMTKTNNDAQEYIRFVAEQATPGAMRTREIECASEQDPDMQEICEKLRDGQWHKLNCKMYLPMRNELSSIGHLVLHGTRIMVPKVLHDQMLDLAHEGHPGIVSMKSRLRSKVWWPGIDKAIEGFCKHCYGC